MSNRWAARLALWLTPVVLAAWATVEVYRAYLNHWLGSLRAPLILGSLAGIAFIVIGTAVVTWQDRINAMPGTGLRNVPGEKTKEFGRIP